MEDYVIEEIYKQIGRKIREEREKQGISQAELAKKIQTSTATITHYENGTRRIPIHHFEKIRKYLDKSFDYFVNENNIKYSTSTREKIIAVANLIDNTIHIPVIEFEEKTPLEYEENEEDILDFNNKPTISISKDDFPNAEFAYKLENEICYIYAIMDTTRETQENDYVLMGTECNINTKFQKEFAIVAYNDYIKLVEREYEEEEFYNQIDIQTNIANTKERKSFKEYKETLCHGIVKGLIKVYK